MSLAIRPATRSHEQALAHLLDEIDRYYGSTHICSAEKRLAEVRLALFEDPPMSRVLLACQWPLP
jgi:hypothetical protein